jgi:hypothetical protein
MLTHSDLYADKKIRAMPIWFLFGFFSALRQAQGQLAEDSETSA